MFVCVVECDCWEEKKEGLKREERRSVWVPGKISA